VALADDLVEIRVLAAAHGDAGDVVSAVIPAEPTPGDRVYLCTFDGADGFRSWLAVASDGTPVGSRRQLREAVSIAALCEIAAESAGGGDLEALLDRLREVRETEAPAGIDDAEAAARALRDLVGEPPHLATPARLDEIGAAARRLEQALDAEGGSPFSATIQGAQGAVSELQREVEAGYRLPLDDG
jgi:hypothetical protein